LNLCLLAHHGEAHRLELGQEQRLGFVRDHELAVHHRQDEAHLIAQLGPLARQLGHHGLLALRIQGQPRAEVLPHDVHGLLVLLDLPRRVEKHHV